MRGADITTQYDNFAWLAPIMGMMQGEGKNKTAQADADAIKSSITTQVEEEGRAARFAGLFDFLKSKQQPAQDKSKVFDTVFNKKSDTVKWLAIGAIGIGVVILLVFLLKGNKPKAT